MNLKMLRLSFKSIIGVLLIFVSFHSANCQQLKSVVYDFDGLNLDQTDLPDGDYSVNDLTYKIDSNPLPPNDMLGDRVLKLNLNWNKGNGTFGRGVSRYIEFDPNQDMFNFYFYNPLSNNQDATLDVVITEDDDQSNTYDYSKDDTWKKSLVIPGSSGWRFISVSLKDFIDLNQGGNGIFDIGFTQNKGMLLQVKFRFTKSSSGLSNPVFYIDMINFSDGDLPRGATDFDLPNKNPSDYCLLGAYNPDKRGQEHLIPTHIESLFPVVQEKKLKYAHFYLQFAIGSSILAKELPGNEVQTLLNNGYTPVITWEPLFQGFDRLDPRQPRLKNIINGDYNLYIDDFANKIKTYTDTVIIRFMHEFDGNWYPWSISQNNQDPALYVSAFRTVVDRFRARGATNVKWMWCVNSDYFPYSSYNWMVPAYPGDNYVDIVAIDVYNNNYPVNLPWWKSFRTKIAESYYYVTKYFPRKPLYICELGCRERLSMENASSESKDAWFEQMDKELQSNFHKVRALMFFNAAKYQKWVINSSAGSMESLTKNIWYDDYYFKTSTLPNALTVITSPANNSSFNAGTTITIQANAFGGTGKIQKVEFFADSIKLGEDVTSPYSFTWNNVSQKKYELTTKATDSVSNTAVSSKVTITVYPPEVICSTTGTITREVWDNISGTSVTAIPLGIAPTSTGYLSVFQSPENRRDNYGERIRGYVCPPFTGSYNFWIASDDNSELWLSTNDNPANKRKIASVSGWTMVREWSKYATQKSSTLNLVAGQKYYIEVLHKEGTQGDHVAVGWQLPNGNLERPIPGNRLSPFVTSSSSCIAAITPMGALTFCSGSVLLNAYTDIGYTYQWKKDGTTIADATNPSYIAATTGDYQVKITQGNCMAWSSITKVTLNTSLTARIIPGGPTSFCLGSSVLLYANTCSGYTYQWKRNGIVIPGATDSTYTATLSGDYQVKIVQGSVVAWSALTTVTVSSCKTEENFSKDLLNKDSLIAGETEIKNRDEPLQLKIYPNPTNGQFLLEMISMNDFTNERFIIEVTDALGQLVYLSEPTVVNGNIKKAIELDKELPTGMYFLKVTIGNKEEVTRVMLAK